MWLAGEMIFAPTNIAHALEDERVDGVGEMNHALTLLPVADCLLFVDCIKGATGEGVDKAFGSGVDYGDAVATGVVVD